MLRIAGVQLDVSDEESAERRHRRVLDILDGLRDAADLVVLPELWWHGAFATAPTIADVIGGADPRLAQLQRAADAGGFVLHAGSFAEVGPQGRPYNTSLVLAPGQGEAVRYRKVHLFGFTGGEAEAFSAGEEPVVWDSPWGPVGLSTCYDLRFPELYRAESAAGAQMFLVPAGWPASRIGNWSLLARARAVENQAFVVAVNCVGTHADVPMGGRSVIVDPRGTVVAEAGPEREEILTATVDLSDAAVWRDRFPVLADRRM